MSRRAVTAVGLLLMAIGAVVIALPDDNERLFSFSEEHGPSTLDGLGIAILLAGWGMLAGLVWTRRHVVASTRAPAIVAGAVMACGGVLLLPAIAFDLGRLWLFAVALMCAAQAYLLFAALR